LFDHLAGTGKIAGKSAVPEPEAGLDVRQTVRRQSG
jgi:hypothetical protein